MTEALSPSLQALKVAARSLVQSVGGGEAAASFCRVSQPVLSTYGNINVTTAFMPIDVVVALESITVGLPGWPQVTRALASAQGCTLLPPPEERPKDKTWVEHICGLTKEMSDVIAPISAAACKGKITARDIVDGDWIREADELIRAAIEFKAALLKVGESDGGQA
ncbi:MAG: phage regulatory CII family protein [Janthinobacterium lividum]